MIGAGVRDSCGKSASGRPCRCKPRRLPDRPRKASAWNGNKRPNGQTTNKL
ncbi:hypothetical protein KEH51_18415 [[Brevibacterium] frigoritolerans]|uniref:Uncharacterized protein n=1 Tax=Peribacillus frigoritolerans TaxID=450367 RepID=A0A941J871_9BACI|nr:hypothetical protein [Peribacillus frigoritolerans]